MKRMDSGRAILSALMYIYIAVMLFIISSTVYLFVVFPPAGFLLIPFDVIIILMLWSKIKRIREILSSPRYRRIYR